MDDYGYVRLTGFKLLKPPLCKDCKYKHFMSDLCTHEEATLISLIDGDVSYIECSEMRSSGSDCNYDGKLFEGKEDAEEA